MWPARTPGVPEVVVPAALDKFEPQIRAHLMEQIEAARQAPHDPLRHATLGLAYGANNCWEEARESFQAALKLDPNHLLAAYSLAEASHVLSYNADAITTLRETLQMYPDYAPAHHRLGVLLLEAGEVDAASAAQERAVTLAGDQPHGYIGLAEVALRTGDNERAVELLTKALRLAPEMRITHYLLGTAYRNLGRRSDAVRELELGAGGVIQYMPTEWIDQMRDHGKLEDFQFRSAQSYLNNGQLGKAIEVLETLLQWHPDNIDALDYLAKTYREHKQPHKACEVLLRAAQLLETDADAYINLAACHLSVGEHDLALRYVDRSIELAPYSARAHGRKGMILSSLRQAAAAAEALSTAVQLKPQNPELRMELARAYGLMERYADAKEQFAAALMHAPDSLYAQLGYCEVCIRLGDLDEAYGALAAARDLAPNHRQVQAMAARLEAATNP